MRGANAFRGHPQHVRTALAIVLILLPLAITGVIKYLPALTEHQHISSVAILHPHLIGPKEFTYLENDVAKQLTEALMEVPGLSLRDLPARDFKQVRDDLSNNGVAALIVPTLTIDGGLVQLDLQVIESQTGRVIFKTPYESSIHNYPDMMKAAGEALKRALL